MRNLKKVLSLALALVMLLGMMVVGAGAATKFQDADDIHNKEAVAVLVGMGIMKGRTNGSSDDVLFAPDGTLTRAEAAMMIAQMDLGVDAAAALKGNGSNTFSDVWAGYWAEGAIDYCVEQGYIKGNGAGQFLPGNPVSSVEFGSMALRLLGYDANNEGLVGDQWAVKAASLIRKAGLATSVAANTKPMTRDEMAQMAFNTLTAETVEYNGLNISGDNITITSPATVRRHTGSVSSTNSTYDGKQIQSSITPIRFCEERFPTLKLNRSGENEFKEAYSVWTYRGVEIEDSKIALNCISTTKKEADNTWMTNVKGFDRNSSIYVNGKQLPDGYLFADLYKLTGNGRLVEVYVNPDDLSAIEKVVVIDTVPGEVTKVASDGKVTIKLLETNGVNPDKSVDVKMNHLVTTDDKTVIDGEFKKGDLVLVNAYGKNPIEKGSTVAKVFAPEVREEFVIRKNYKDGKPVSVDTGDTTGIKDARNVISDFDINKFTVNDKNKDSVLYLDQYGYIVKIVDWKDTTPTDGLIAVKDVYQDVEGRKIVDRVAGVISNGETIELAYNKNADVSLKVGRIYVYSDSNNDDIYDLKLVDEKSIATGASAANTYVANKWDTAQKLNFRSNDTKGNSATNASKYFYSDSVKFIFADQSNKDVTVLNGRQTYSSDKLKVVAQALDKNGEISAVFLEAEPDFVNLDDIIFVWTRKSKDEVVGSDKQTIYYGYEAYNSDGTEIEDFFGTTGTMTGEKDEGKFYKKNIVKDGDVTAYKPIWSDKVGAHTIESNWITYANGTRGDSFIIGGVIDPDTKKPVELLTNSKTKVIDLYTDDTITTPAELNETMNKDGKAVKVAVVYTKDTVNKTYDVHTIFVTYVGDTGSYKDHEVKPGETPSEEVTVKFDGTAVKDTDYTVTGPTDGKYTVTAKNGANISVVSGTGYSFAKKADGSYEVTITATSGTVTVKVNKGTATAGNVKWADTAKQREADFVGSGRAFTQTDPSTGATTLSVFFQVKAADWARPNTTPAATFSAVVKDSGGNTLGTATDIKFTSIPAYDPTKGEVATMTFNGTLTATQGGSAIGVPAEDLTVEITEIKYDKVAIKYVDDNDAAIDSSKLVAATAGTATTETAVGNSSKIQAVYAYPTTGATVKANVVADKGITGAAPAAATLVFTTDGYTKKDSTSDSATWDGSAFTVSGDSAVTVKITGVKDLKDIYTITINDGSSIAPNVNDSKDLTTGVALTNWNYTGLDKALLLKLSFKAAGDASVTEGKPFVNENLQVTIGTSAGTLNAKAIKVTVDGFGEATVTAQNTATSLKGSGVTITKDTTITADMVHVELIEDKLQLDATAGKIKWAYDDKADQSTVTLVFTEKVTKATAEEKDNYTLAGTSLGSDKKNFVNAVLQGDGKTVILTFNGKIFNGSENDNKITLTANIESTNASGANVPQKTAVTMIVTLGASGATTVANS